MYLAKILNGSLISITDALKREKETYVCPTCKEPLIIRNGAKNCAHFSHKSTSDCDSFGKEMTEWHYQWQERFHKKNREVSLPFDNPIHRADVLACGYVVEFQHSKLSISEFEERNQFYTGLGYKIIWVVDCIDEIERNRFVFDDDFDNSPKREKVRWSHTSKYDYLCAWNYNQKDVIIILQLGEATEEADNEEQSYLVKIDWAYCEGGMSDFNKAFYVSSDKVYNANTLKKVIIERSL